MLCCTFVGHEELEDLSLGHSGKKENEQFTKKKKKKQASFHRLKVLEDECRQLHSFQYTDAKILTPCTHGCSRTCAALKRSVASRTSSFEMRSLAPSVMWAQSLSGNSYFPCWILSNNWLCGGKDVIRWNQNNTRQDQIHNSKWWLENRRGVFFLPSWNPVEMGFVRSHKYSYI